VAKVDLYAMKALLNKLYLFFTPQRSAIAVEGFWGIYYWDETLMRGRFSYCVSAGTHCIRRCWQFEHGTTYSHRI
jgi:hypothetical protein